MTVSVDPLSVYGELSPCHHGERTLVRLVGLSLLVSTSLGLLMLAVDAPAVAARVSREAQRITFHAPVAPEPEPVVVPEPEPEPLAPEPEPEPLDLTEPDLVLAQAVDEPAPEPEPTPPPRRVYGVRKVLARGLGESGRGAVNTGLVVKRGNVLDGVADTLTATVADLQGQLAALSTVERAPEPVHRVKPAYSEALIAARAGGTVTARVLVDTDGRVARVEVTEDIGQDSAQVATAALSQFRFRPALRHGEPVAVWILHRIRFEFQE